jgi:ABC-2 type transport system ATP-binding protein
MTVTHAGDGRPAVVAVEDLTKRYGSQVAVDGLSLEIPRGVVAGFIGPNGAGKTTTMAMLLGLVRPTSGTGTVLEHPLDQPSTYLDRVGALVEGPAFWPGLTGVENLRVVAELGGHDPGQIPRLLDLVRLSGRGRDRFGEYSLGMKQRLGIAAALIGEPELLVLDEPTNGLDPAGINQMRDLIAEISHDDRTVVVSSHLLSEVEQVCDRVAIIDRGLVVAAGSPDQLARSRGVEVETDRGVQAFPAATREDVPGIVERLVRAGERVYEVRLVRSTLEDAYLAAVHAAAPAESAAEEAAA